MRAPATIVLAVLLLAGCGGGDGDGDGEEAASAPAPPTSLPSRPQAQPLEPARCPDSAANCRSADGRVLYVERVDPDGDGDAHLVLASDESVTGPGISVIDVRRGLRPRPLPGPGDRVSAAGPVFEGSYGQRQIQANVLHVAGR